MFVNMVRCSIAHNASSAASQKEIIVHSTTKVNNFTHAQRNVTKLGKGAVKGSEERLQI